jgi:hypothetical protein
MGSRPVVAFVDDIYKLNPKNSDYKYENCTRNLVGRLFGRCLSLDEY